MSLSNLMEFEKEDRDMSKYILGIDPGPAQSATVLYDAESRKVLSFGIDQNSDVLEYFNNLGIGSTLVIEMIASYGMPVGAEVFNTCVWIGRFIQEWQTLNNGPAFTVKRLQIKSALCHSAKANDANIRAALIDLFGPGKDKAIGCKKAPGPLYGVKSDV